MIAVCGESDEEYKRKVILSGYPSELYTSLYGRWDKVEKDSIAGI
jgi:hypothetical protein